MNAIQLKTFRTVAATLSFTRAAELLDYAQSSVSAQIRGLEAELGAPLFDRIGRRVALTGAGQQVLAYSDRLLALEDEVRTSLHRPAGQGALAPVSILRLGAPESVMTHWLPRRLARFHADWPGVQLEYAPLVDAELYRRVLDGRLGFALLLQPPVRVEALAVQRLSGEPLYVLAAPGHPLADRKDSGARNGSGVRNGAGARKGARAPRRVSARDLVGQTVFLTESGCGYRHLFEQELAKQGHYACLKLEFSSVEAIKRCVAQGLGVGFLPRLAVQDLLDQGALVALRWEKRFAVDLQLVWHRQKWLAPAEERWVEVCQERMKAA